MVFSTLLPTLIHFGVFLSALVFFIPSRAKCEEMIQTIQTNDDVEKWDTGEERRMAQILALPWPIGAVGALLSAVGLFYLLGYFMEQWYALALWGSSLF